MALVVIPQAGLKPLTHGINLESGVIHHPPTGPGMLQGSNFMCEAFKCIPYGIGSYTVNHVLLI